MSINDLINGRICFVVPSYQRGYRWSNDQIERLLLDLYDFGVEKNNGNPLVGDYYCLQPIVVKELDESDNDFNKEHYHPFYLALSHKLDNRITIDEANLKYTGVHIEYAHPCTLSNGGKVQIDRNGDWIIKFEGNCPSDVPGLVIDSSGTGKIDCTKKDSIEHMANFLNSL